jgi:hypothetical protein
MGLFRDVEQPDDGIHVLRLLTFFLRLGEREHQRAVHEDHVTRVVTHERADLLALQLKPFRRYRCLSIHIAAIFIEVCRQHQVEL